MSIPADCTTTDEAEYPKLRLYVFLFGAAAAVTMISAALAIATTIYNLPNAPLNFSLASMIVLWVASFETRNNPPRRSGARPPTTYPDAERLLFEELDRKLRGDR